MLDDGGERHRERLGELAYRGRAATQPFDQRPSGRVGQRLKEKIERGILV
jgi:hypothetical protein